MTSHRQDEALGEGTVHSLVAAHARSLPDQVAVLHREQRLTYAELEARAVRLANSLRSLGVAEGDRVGVCLEPELDVPATVLAILKIGAAYVPLDPQYPAHRIAEIVADVRPRVIVSRSGLRDRLAESAPGALLLLDDHAALIEGQPTELPPLADDPSRIATIFFTSGTTGRPKGARASHRQLAFYTRAARNRFALSPADVVPTIARFSFSISIFELLMPLTAGATVQVLDRDVVMDPVRMAEALEGVTLFHMGPSLLRGVLGEMLREPERAARYARVRHASSGGDMIPPQVLTAMRKALPAAEVFVLYGCSEISCMGTWYAVPSSGDIARTYVGRPFDEMQLAVLDESLQPVAAGTPGEVFFAGPGVIAGYLDRPELDAERFVSIDGVRYYRTGDVGRWNEAHGLELLGRADFQIKVRGMRVESAEVEYHLRQVAGVRDAAVALRERRGEMVLAAFVVRSDPAVGEDANALGIRVRRLLSERVPDYMVPSAIVELGALPLNHNLKLDRRALPELATPVLATNVGQAPRTETERWMAGIWCELLERESVGRRQNFFELGGDSLLGLQLILRVQRERSVRLDGMDVLRESLATLAHLVDPTSPALSDDSEEDAALAREGFFFGVEAGLYGHLISRTGVEAERGVLICAPVGFDDVRATFVISLLMTRLALAGIPVMRFDFRGTRDSLGETTAGNPALWCEDILAARAALIARTGISRVTAVGFRLGGTLVSEVLAAAQWDAAIVVDPVCNGTDFLQKAQHEQALRMSGLNPAGRKATSASKSEAQELLGFTWSSIAVQQLQDLRLTPPAIPLETQLSWVSSSDSPVHRAAYAALRAQMRGGRYVALPTAVDWDSGHGVLQLSPDKGMVDALLSCVGAAS